MKYHNNILASHLLHTYGEMLSDEQVKTIRECSDKNGVAESIMRRGGPFNIREIEHLVHVAGNEPTEEEWTDDILDKYADYVYNYKYTYNDEALKVDPNTDTSQEHIGPMAQDLEKVNPATVIEDEATGYKKVDTGRLALMNAGAIANLAREVAELKNGK